MHTFGARLRAARNAVGMTQGQLGELVGVTNAAVSRWESDIDQPQVSTLPALRDALRVSLDQLVCGSPLVQYVIEPSREMIVADVDMIIGPASKTRAKRSASLSPMEAQLIDLLRGLPEKKLLAAIELLKTGR